MKIRITALDQKPMFRVYSSAMNIRKITESVQADLPYEILACKIDNVSSSLDTVIDRDCTLELLDLRSPVANMQRPFCAAGVSAAAGNAGPSRIDSAVQNAIFTGAFHRTDTIL